MVSDILYRVCSIISEFCTAAFMKAQSVTWYGFSNGGSEADVDHKFPREQEAMTRT